MTGGPIIRAIVHATGVPADGIGERCSPTVLMELGDRPLIQRVIEQLAGIGVRDVDLIVCNQPHRVRAFLGDGARWGCRFRWHLSQDPNRPYRALSAMSMQEETLILARADLLIVRPVEPFLLAMSASKPCAICWRKPDGKPGSGELTWTGWASLDQQSFKRVRKGGTEEEFAEDLLRIAHREGSIVEVDPPIHVSSLASLIPANRAAFASGRPILGPEIKRGVYAGRRASIHPTATLTPPVFIGEYSRIGAGVRLGPFASIGRDCIVAHGCNIKNSVLLPGTYIGPGLHVEDTVADGARMMNVRLNASAVDATRVLLGAVPQSLRLALPAQLVPWTAAVVLALLAAPAYAASFVRRRLARRGAEAELTTHANGRAGVNAGQANRDKMRSALPFLRHFLNDVIPALPGVVMGRSALIGSSTWTPQDLAKVPCAWRDLCASAPAGIITESLIRFGPNPTLEERSAADVHFSIRQSAAHNASLLVEYAVHVGRDVLARLQLIADRDQTNGTQGIHRIR